jgi:hypothetical protein
MPSRFQLESELTVAASTRKSQYVGRSKMEQFATTNHQPPTTNHQPPTTNRQPLTTNQHSVHALNLPLRFFE